jgi:hypothetical protein
MKKLAIFVSLVACAFLWPLQVEAQSAPQTQANTAEQQAFQHEFDDVCARTQDAMLLTKDELKDLMRRCDALVPKLTKLDETQRKVYKRRLEQCRGLFAYVLDTKKDSDK